MLRKSGFKGVKFAYLPNLAVGKVLKTPSELTIAMFTLSIFSVYGASVTAVATNQVNKYSPITNTNLTKHSPHDIGKAHYFVRKIS
ncbi:hypothetical protein GPLA_3147 [Paraglaciecola polaris LMG 21857]|uniref:Uncharacterized protein n=1 Tax=Paraglaciecola polaris LMG 21857 TaxID=1129793 RepID=K6ZZ75_9ALTE|nr:hypothetical protein GPLA_3147 [Paraglaciecola polaris LMG 21857]